MMKTMRFQALLCSCLLLLTLLSGCKKPVNIDSGAAAQEYPVAACGVELSEKPGSVVVLSDSIADVVLALGYEKQVTAVTEACTQLAYSTLPRVSAADTQNIKSLAPDLVLTDPAVPEATRTALADAGLKVACVTPPADRGDFERLYREVGAMLEGAKTGYENGQKTAADICQTLDDIERIIPDNKGVLVTAALIFDLDGNGVTGGMFFNSVMESAGLSNVFSGQSSGRYDKAMLKTLNPNFIFCPESLVDDVRNDKSLLKNKAVTEKQVIGIPEETLRRTGRTVVSLATTMAGAAYPQLREEQNTDPTTSVDQIVYDTLEYGDENDNVRNMQAKLYDLGFLTVSSYDGYYGYATRESVIAFQKANGLPDNGIADNETLQVLFSDAAKGCTD